MKNTNQQFIYKMHSQTTRNRIIRKPFQKYPSTRRFFSTVLKYLFTFWAFRWSGTVRYPPIDNNRPDEWSEGMIFKFQQSANLPYTVPT